MTNLQYEIRMPQKIYRRVTIHFCAWYDFLRNRRYHIKISSIYSRNQIITNLISCCGPFLAPKLFFIWLWNEARNRSLNEQWLCKFLISLESLLKFHKHISKILPWIFFWFRTRTFVLRCIDCQSAGLEGPNISPVPWSP